MVKFLGELALIAAAFLVYFLVNVYGGVVLFGAFLVLTFPRFKWLIVGATIAILIVLFYLDFSGPLCSHPKRQGAALAILGGGVVLLWLYEKIQDNDHKWYGQVGSLLFGAAFTVAGLYLWSNGSWNEIVALLLFCGLIIVMPAAQGLIDGLRKRDRRE